MCTCNNAGAPKLLHIRHGLPAGHRQLSNVHRSKARHDESCGNHAQQHFLHKQHTGKAAKALGSLCTALQWVRRHERCSAPFLAMSRLNSSKMAAVQMCG
jgi:hypothetical protein